MAMIYCTECGNQISDKAMFCPNCGNPVRPTSPNYSYSGHSSGTGITDSQCVDKLAAKEQTSGIIWMVIAILQFMIGLAGAWIVLVIAILNALAAIGSFQKAKKVKQPYPGMVEEYDKQLTSFIISLVYNAVFGGVIGVAGNVFDLVTRNYVLSNRAIFERMAGEQVRKTDAEAATSGKVRLTVQYSCTPGAATAARYTVDAMPVKHLVTNAAPVTLYLTPGVHTISFKYNFKDFAFWFELHENCTLSFLGTLTEIKLNRNL